MSLAIRTIEAVYERGYLRPVEPIEAREGLIYIVTVVDMAAVGRKSKSRTPYSLRGKYRGYLSTTEDFVRNKQVEKALEL
jgi:predicted DNA-binding antitoxin AbrB/MazE fold protein